MNTRNVENRLALVGAILVLIGVTFAAGSAFASGMNDVSSTAVAIHTAADHSLELARTANHTAVADAANAIVLDVQLDLDIRHSDRRSILLAGTR
jgi:hypothetical protein